MRAAARQKPFLLGDINSQSWEATTFLTYYEDTADDANYIEV